MPTPASVNDSTSSGIVIPPKPLAPCPCPTDPPLHPESTMAIALPTAVTSPVDALLYLDGLLVSPLWELVHPHPTPQPFSPHSLTCNSHTITGKR